jgi:dTDP-4-dehydrorhamnose reductase
VRIAVTGAGGRLGRAIVAALEEAPFTGPKGPTGWTRAEFDLDHPAVIDTLIRRDRPEVIIHSAAWTDVDGCAKDPELARARNADAVGIVAEAAAANGIDLVLVSTNEVFDGARTDGRGYAPDDAVNPINAYGASKAAGEIAAARAYGTPRPSTGASGGVGSAGSQLAIVRTSWLFGPPGNDFPQKILAAADRARDAGQPLKVVGDEIGSPTFTEDLAEAIIALLWSGEYAGVHHLVNSGHTSRAGWARELLRQVGRDDAIEEVPASTWTRASTAPLWAVLEPTPLPDGEPMPTWQTAVAHYLPALRRQREAAGA